MALMAGTIGNILAATIPRQSMIIVLTIDINILTKAFPLAPRNADILDIDNVKGPSKIFLLCLLGDSKTC